MQNFKFNDLYLTMKTYLFIAVDKRQKENVGKEPDFQSISLTVERSTK